MPPPSQPPAAPPAASADLLRLEALLARMERELAALGKRTLTVSPASHLRLTPSPTGYIVEDMAPR